MAYDQLKDANKEKKLVYLQAQRQLQELSQYSIGHSLSELDENEKINFFKKNEQFIDMCIVNMKVDSSRVSQERRSTSLNDEIFDDFVKCELDMKVISLAK